MRVQGKRRSVLLREKKKDGIGEKRNMMTMQHLGGGKNPHSHPPPFPPPPSPLFLHFLLNHILHHTTPLEMQHREEGVNLTMHDGGGGGVLRSNRGRSPDLHEIRRRKILISQHGRRSLPSSPRRCWGKEEEEEGT